jgi:hypothetical protein
VPDIEVTLIAGFRATKTFDVNKADFGVNLDGDGVPNEAMGRASAKVIRKDNTHAMEITKVAHDDDWSALCQFEHAAP